MVRGEHNDELPRFISLLRMAHGPVDRDEQHCGVQMVIEELEELTDEQFFDAEAKARCILTCRECGQVSWAWFD
jgi:hypothetical protein